MTGDGSACHQAIGSERLSSTLVGHAPSVALGASASGNWVTDRGHGRPFRAEFV
jgi:hypothetical protein